MWSSDDKGFNWQNKIYKENLAILFQNEIYNLYKFEKCSSVHKIMCTSTIYHNVQVNGSFKTHCGFLV